MKAFTLAFDLQWTRSYLRMARDESSKISNMRCQLIGVPIVVIRLPSVSFDSKEQPTTQFDCANQEKFNGNLLDCTEPNARPQVMLESQRVGKQFLICLTKKLITNTWRIVFAAL